jgi:hypothetical protein
MKDYITRNIIAPLTYALQGGTLGKERVVAAMNYCLQSKNTDARNILGFAMLPFYQDYFYADDSIIGYEKWEVREVIGYCMGSDDFFYDWLSDGFNLLETAHCWAAYHKKCCQSHHADAFLRLLESMTHTFYGHECLLESSDIRQELIRERIEGNAHSREVYCIMHAFITIWLEEHYTLKQKIRFFKLLHRHWYFIRAIYSAMLQSVVGYGYMEIAAIAHCVKNDRRHHPHLHLFYSAVMEHKERIVRCGTKRDKLENVLTALREIVTSTTPSDELDELCNILFSDKLKEYLEKHRLKSYRELEHEVHTLRSNLEKNANEMQSLIDKQVEMLSETSIPVEVIYDELKNLSGRFPGMAYEVYEKLNALLIKNEVWSKNAGKIRDMIWERMQQPAIKAEHYYAQGSVHQDASRHISMSNENKLIGQA